MQNYSHEYVPDYPSEPAEEQKSKAPVIRLAAFAACLVFIIVALVNIDSMRTEMDGYLAEIEELKDQAAYFSEVAEANDKLDRENKELILENTVLAGENDRLKTGNIILEAENDVLTAANEELESLHGEQLEKIRWVEEAERRPQPEGEFKITFYSTSYVSPHLVPRETVAMNSQQVADLGLKRGDEIYVKSNKGWSGFYRITDSGCAYGTIDIYVNSTDIPHWGVEYGVQILI